MSALLTCLFILFFSTAYGQATELQLSADSVAGLPGTEVVVPIRVKGFDKVITGQGTISFDPKVVTLVKVEQYGLPGLNAFNFGTTNSEKGELLFSWDDALLEGVTLAENAVIFAIRFKVAGDYGSSSRINFLNSPAQLEFSNHEFRKSSVALKAGKVQVPAYVISTGAITPSTFCAGNKVAVPFTAQGAFATGNTFTAQLSDANGSFVNATSLGGNSTSPILATLPATVPGGTGYRIRVVSTAPVVEGSDNGSNLTINAVPSAPSVSAGSSCGPGSVTLTASGAPANASYRWYPDALSSDPIPDQTGGAFTTPVLSTTTTYYVTIVSQQGCESSRVPVQATVYDLKAITAGADEEVCLPYAPFQLKGASPAGGSWTGKGVTTSGLFDPVAAGVGIHTLTYTFTCQNGSKGEDTKQIRVIDVHGKPTIQKIGTDSLAVDMTGAVYEWEANGTILISDLNGIKIKEPGFYRVRVLDGPCTSEFSDLFSVSFFSDFNVYPNPSNGVITLDGPTLTETVEIELVNSIGKKMYHETLSSFTGKAQFSLRHLSPDLYFMTIRTSNVKKVFKLVFLR
ncbi:T9SS type A sorting domain-containing protein [Sabulibacter ruber]|uniref:Ig-like domain-containing protein n=1 Tax=Sabulibacter ruber TaxID=2811901 RepID=UPI001A96BAEB|nr:T9SS type A sorting domain-containing protein [Sabulibacter ruber]